MTTQKKPQDVVLGLVGEIPVQITVELGKTRLTVNELSLLSKGSIIQLEQKSGELLTIFANGKLIARGETVLVNDCFGIRVNEVLL